MDLLTYMKIRPQVFTYTIKHKEKTMETVGYIQEEEKTKLDENETGKANEKDKTKSDKKEKTKTDEK